MKTLTIEILDNTTIKEVKEILTMNRIKFDVFKPENSGKVIVPKALKKLSKAGQAYEDKVDKNLAKHMQAVDLRKTVKESTVMRNLLQ